ncbi:tRNA epoxyqueuosine(34) reductase QueG [Hellea balneolensis]|uniref:tRNA epoxyqueuosine(34) reductase QueG n=1 Tax=Hellea balneolensis TaxID=287478 RepID=UPI0003FB5A67|nr:tRNA epoxyqueuosine(34) reductase QueG [Hellea balneolensis]
MTALSKRVLKRCQALGFTPPHIVDLNQFGTVAGQGLRDFIAKHHHGTMAWLAETETRRNHPQNLWAEARSAIVLGLNYGPETDPLVTLTQKEKATISVYARNRDYHDIIKGRLKELGGLIAQDTHEDIKVFVDTAPLMEKPLAAMSGLGWQGKHTNLVNRDYGSWLFLGVILSAAPLTPTPPEIDHCGTCRGCLDICPTDAFPAPYQLDARKCISYLTIEHKGAVDEDLRVKMGNRIYGCDDCLAVCPWNKFAQEASEIKLKARPDLEAPDLAALASLSDAEFRTHFSGSPIKRIGRTQFIRNVLYAIGNSARPDLINAAVQHSDAADAVVREAAKWAIERLKS